jgi:hypothetical protein
LRIPRCTPEAGDPASTEHVRGCRAGKITGAP